MFTRVYRLVLGVLLCALIVQNALPTRVVHSQNQDTEAATTTDASTAAVPAGASGAPPYPIEGIPGAGAPVGDFVVGPGKIDLTLKPGESKVVEMMVTNRTGERRIFNLTTEDAVGSDNYDSPIVLLGTDRGPYSLKDYLTVPHTRFELGQNERARIPVTISIPADAEPGGLYGSVIVDTVAVESQSGEADGTVPQSAIVARIGTLFFITVPGTIARDGSLTDFGTSPRKTFYGSGPIKFGIYYENRGPIHLAPSGEIRIKNMLGDEVDYVQLEPWFVLPNSKRLREVSWNRELLIGRYTATAQINRSYDDKIDTLSYSFWVLPWKILLAIFSAVFVVFFLIRTFFRSFEFKRKR